MKRTRHRPSISRRTALRRMAVGTAGVVGLADVAFARRQAKPEIRQVTTEDFSQSNIYCEIPYCSRDSRYFVYERSNPGSNPDSNPDRAGNRIEWMVVELGTWKQHRLDAAKSLTGCAISHDGVFYYLKKTGGGELDLMRADLCEGTPQRVYRMKEEPWNALGTISADGRYYAMGKRLDDRWTSFGIVLFDLDNGRHEVIDRDPFILNPHPQFEPGESKHLMIQHNRGGKFTPQGKRLQLVGPQGATLYLLSVPDGKRTELQVGKPFTSPCTGHEAWIGKTKEMLLSVSAREDYAPEKGNLLGVRAGGPARVVAKGYRFNHVGVSRCGGFFCGDDWQRSYKLVIGSTRTGRTVVVCDSGTRPDRSQSSHPHGYLTPDLRWVIFNSNRSGRPHIYAAGVDEGTIRELAKT